MHRDSESESWLAIILGVLVLATWGIASAFEVPWKVAISVLPGAVGWFILAGILIYFGMLNIFSPILVGCIVRVIQPILDFWAGTDGDGITRMDPPWYGVTGWQITLSLCLMICGYAIIYWRKSR